MPKLFQAAALASHLGVKPEKVASWRQCGLSPHDTAHRGDGSAVELYDPARVLSWLRANGLGDDVTSGESGTEGSATVATLLALVDDPESCDLDEARRKSVLISAADRRVRLDQRIGKLVPVEEIESRYGEILGVLRSRLDALPAQVSQAVMVAMNLPPDSETSIRLIVQDKVRAVMAEVAGG